MVIGAEAEKSKTVTVAEGDLQSAKLNAQAVTVEGTAEGAAETAKLMAPVNSQIALAKEIGQNENYQKYLIALKSIEANQTVGVEQAKALGVADIKVISNVGTPPEGLRNVMDIFSAKGGTQLGAAIEAIVNTPTGKAISEKLGLNGGPAAHG
jgi:flotillin